MKEERLKGAIAVKQGMISNALFDNPLTNLQVACSVAPKTLSLLVFMLLWWDISRAIVLREGLWLRVTLVYASNFLQEQGCSCVYSKLEEQVRAWELGISGLAYSPSMTEAHLIVPFSSQPQTAPQDINVPLCLRSPSVICGNKYYLLSFICLWSNCELLQG